MGSEHFIEGNPDSSTVICTFWTLAQPVAQKFDSQKFAICANQYSYDALNTIVRAIWMNPHWRHLVLMGADLTHAGDIWTAFFNEGVENGKVKGTSFAFQPEIPLDALEKFRENVTLHDLRGKSFEEVEKVIRTLEKKPPFAPPPIIPGT
jgi:tetrahydromethanopterin S-methyltransferase subunit A